MKVRTGIEVSSQTDLGCVRQNNEDSFGYWEPEDDREFQRKGRLAVVADGMGGYEGGQEASRLAVETLVAVYRDFRGDDPQQALIEGLQTAHEQIREYSFAHPELRGMGTTCTAAAIVRIGDAAAQYDALYYVHVGDTRLYLIRGHARSFLCEPPRGVGIDHRRTSGNPSAAEYSDSCFRNKPRSHHGFARPARAAAPG